MFSRGPRQSKSEEIGERLRSSKKLVDQAERQVLGLLKTIFTDDVAAGIDALPAKGKQEATQVIANAQATMNEATKALFNAIRGDLERRGLAIKRQLS